MLRRRNLKGFAYLALLFLFLSTIPGGSAKASGTQTGGFILLSAGKDGIVGTDDDIYVTEKGEVVKGKADLATLKLTFADLIPSNSKAVFTPVISSITLAANVQSVPADGKTPVTLTATVLDSKGNPVPDGTEVTFSATLGTLSLSSVQTVNGSVSVELVSSTPGQAVVTAYAGNVSSSVTVTFNVVIVDDFNTDSGLWVYGGTAHRDPQKGCLVFVENQTYKVGYVWFKQDVFSPFIAEFDYSIGGGSDGLVFMFYKKKDYTPLNGGYLGFVDSSLMVPGYGIEFDIYRNFLAVDGIDDPPVPYVALIKDTVSNHLQAKQDSRVKDYPVWHRAKIVVDTSLVTVYIDGTKVIEWQGNIAQEFGGIGFAGSSGAISGSQYIDNFRLELPPFK